MLPEFGIEYILDSCGVLASVPSEKHYQAMLLPLAQPSCEKAEGRNLF